MRLRLGTKLSLGIGGLLALLVCVGVFSYVQIRLGQENNILQPVGVWLSMLASSIPPY